jgi:mannose-1-phosphate guanylyltransferase
MGTSEKVQAVILAGGLGTRLRPYTFLVPKPMLPVGPKPILEHILEWLRENGITEVIISTGYLGKMIQDYFGTGKDLGMKIEYATSPRPLGTAGQLKAAESKIRGRFVCIYGDALLEMDLRSVIEFHSKHNALATMTLMEYSTELKYGFMETDEEGRLTEWREKPTISGYINVGCFVMEKAFLHRIPPREMYGMKETFEEAMKKGARLYGFRAKGHFTDIGDRKSYREANDAFVRKMGKVL